MEKRKRHWFLSTVLSFLAITVVLSTINILINSSNYKVMNAKVTDYLIILHTCSAAIEIYLLYLIFRWKK